MQKFTSEDYSAAQMNDQHIDDIEMECVNMVDTQPDRRHVNHQKQVRPERQIIEKKVLLSKALRWHMPVIGEVPLMFYVPECGEPYEITKKLIEEHGGIVVDQHECYTYQVKPENAKLKMKDFYQGPVYISNWIINWINNNDQGPLEIGGNKMLDKREDHLVVQCNSLECKKLNIGKKKKFTIVEGIKLFQIINTNNAHNLGKTSFWVKIQENNLIPERTADQMKKFWTKYEHSTVESWLVKAIHENLDFSLSVKKIPSDSFVQKFKQKYELEFLKMESLEAIGGGEYDRQPDSYYTQTHEMNSSSVYSQNLSRRISPASHNSASAQQVKEIDAASLLNQFDTNQTNQPAAPISTDATTTSTGVQNSQVTQKNSGESQDNVQRGQTTQEAINNSSPFNKNITHINMVDNSVISKLPRVEYEIDFGCFGYDNSQVTEEPTEDTIMEGIHDNLYTEKTRPGNQLDLIFEKKMQKRLASYHNKPIDRTQFDHEMLCKQLDLEVLNITLADNEDDKVREQYISNGGQCFGPGYKRTIVRETNEEGKWKRLINELEQIAQQFSVEFDEALRLFESCSCSKKHFRELLENKSYTQWNNMDDLAVKMDPDSAEYKHLIKLKGPEEVVRRQRFLGLTVTEELPSELNQQ